MYHYLSSTLNAAGMDTGKADQGTQSDVTKTLRVAH
ncbi:hypothetical protein PENCOP_c004G00367 [Penicillium coprophilum]|uniref:Uncharacterized protein n=1 Tax=Penicillium coprophilum TaxID=36646 RepID=A0A1V6UUK4_9EURO|nr:hypothetical protein PENCOP_c004G00367 [Penicillium coprophilum]